jgi:uncharacterized protein YdaU (DUF1376 family)
MPSTPYMKLYIGDYLGDTRHLSLLEHGAYLLLIMAYWQNKGPISGNAIALRRYTGSSQKEYSSWHENVLKMFEVREGMLIHKRIDKELSEREQLSIKNKHNAIKGWSVRNAIALPKISERYPNPIVHSPETKIREEKICGEGVLSTADEIPKTPPPTPKIGTDGTSRFEAAKRSASGKCFPPVRKNLLELRDEDRREILATLSHYSDDEIFSAIRNYAGMLKDDKYEIFAPYASLIGFLRSGVEKFVDESNPKEVFLKRDQATIEKAERDVFFENLKREQNQPEEQDDKRQIG